MSANAVITHIPYRHIPRWTFAERIRKVRRDTGMTQEQFAENVLRLRLSTYSAWESGRNTPDLAMLAPILERQTGVPKEWFLGWMSDDIDDSNMRPTD